MALVEVAHRLSILSDIALVCHCPVVGPKSFVPLSTSMNVVYFGHLLFVSLDVRVLLHLVDLELQRLALEDGVYLLIEVQLLLHQLFGFQFELSDPLSTLS